MTYRHDGSSSTTPLFIKRDQDALEKGQKMTTAYASGTLFPAPVSPINTLMRPPD